MTELLLFLCGFCSGACVATGAALWALTVIEREQNERLYYWMSQSFKAWRLLERRGQEKKPEPEIDPADWWKGGR